MSSAHYWYRWLCLPPYFLLAWYALAGFGAWRRPFLRLNFAVAFGAGLTVGILLLLASLHLSFPAALWTGSALALISSFALHLQTPNPFQKGDWQLAWSRRSLPYLLVFAALGTMIACVAVQYAFHDQTKIQVHPALIESILRGNFPPHLQVFPEIPLKYHFGADLFVAVLSYVTGLPGWQALDILQIAGWALSFGGAYGLCREFGLRPPPAFLAAAWFLLAGGWTYLLQPWLRPQEWGLNYPLIWPDAYPVFQRYLNPGVVSWFFQTPYALGLPLFLAAIGMITRSFATMTWRAWVLSGICIGILSVVQVALFFTLLLATFATLALKFLIERPSWKQGLLPGLLYGAVACVLALKLGGFFDRSGDYLKGLLVFHWPPGYLDFAFDAGRRPITWTESLLWYLCSFGSLCILSPAALIVALRHLRRPFRPELAIFAGIAALSFLLPQFFYYRLTWDIIKWFCIFQIASVFLIVLCGDILAKGKSWFCLALLPLVLLDVTPALRLLYGLSFLKPSDYQGKPRGWFLAVIHPPAPDIAYFAQQFRGRPWNEAVLSSLELSTLFSIHSGQAMAIPDYNTVAFGVSRALLQTRNSWIQQLQQDFSVEKMRASPIRWIVYSCGEYQKIFSEKSKQAIDRAVTEGRLHELQPPGPACYRAYRL